MNVFHSFQEAIGIKNPVVTTGSFDGVHIGHKVIINRLNQLAAEQAGESVLITFHPHPRKVLYPEQKDLMLINSQAEKIELLRKAGLQNLIIFPFSLDFAKTSSHDFIAKILVGTLQAKVIVVGHNHHFGHNREGDFSYLHKLSEEHQFLVEEIPLMDIENETVSSTKIRKALFEGNIQRANAYLDHQFIITGPVTSGNEMLQKAGYANYKLLITEEEKLILPAGIYATNFPFQNKTFKAMTLINADKEVFVHCLDKPDLPADFSPTVYFHKKIRGGDFFGDAFKLQMEAEIAAEEIDELIF